MKLIKVGSGLLKINSHSQPPRSYGNVKPIRKKKLKALARERYDGDNHSMTQEVRSLDDVNVYSISTLKSKMAEDAGTYRKGGCFQQNQWAKSMGLNWQETWPLLPTCNLQMIYSSLPKQMRRI